MTSPTPTLRHDYTLNEIAALFDQPLMSLIHQAQTIHLAHHEPEAIEKAVLLNIKTGACPEDCGYCSQSAHYDTGLEREKLMPLDEVLAAAKEAKEAGAVRFCMGGAWRSPPAAAMPALIDMIKGVNELGLETCMTLGMLKDEQARQLANAGLDYYNHNIDTSEEHYDKVVTTRTFFTCGLLWSRSSAMTRHRKPTACSNASSAIASSRTPRAR